MTDSELRERAGKLSGKEFAQQCWHLLFEADDEFLLPLSTFFREAEEGRNELDKPSLE